MASFGTWKFPCGVTRVPVNRPELLAIVRLLLEESGADPDLLVNDLTYRSASVLILASMASSEVASLIHNYAYPPYQEWPLEERYDDAVRLYSRNLERIQSILGRSLIDQEVFHLDCGNNCRS